MAKAGWLFGLLGALACGAMASRAQAAPADNLLPPIQGGQWKRLEPEADDRGKAYGEMPTGWEDNSSWADVTARYARMTDGPAPGVEGIRIGAERVGDGAVQLKVAGSLAMKRGVNYVLEGSFRSQTGTAVTIQVRQPDAPYRSYAERDLVPSPEWRTSRWLFSVKDDADAWFLLVVRGAGQVDVAELRLRVAPEESDEPARAGNLLAHPRPAPGSVNGWLLNQPEDMSTGHRVTRDGIAAEAGSPLGGPSLQALGPFNFSSPPVHAAYGRTHTASVWVKAEKPGEFRLRVCGASDGHQALFAGDTVGPEWKRLVASGKLPLVPGERYYVQLQGPEGRCWVDGFRLEEGEQAGSFGEAAGADVSLRPVAAWGLVAGEAPQRLQVVVAGPIPAGAALRLTLVHTDGSTETLAPLAVPAGKGWRAEIPVSGKQVAKYGMVRVEGLLADAAGKPLSQVAETFLARVPVPRPVPAERSYFGVHAALREPDLAVVKALGFHWLRLHDASKATKWGYLETEPGKWQWLDHEIDLACHEGFSILGLLDTSPTWASEAKGRPLDYFSVCYPPKDLGQWENYVRAVVGRYRGKIAAWEVWNEPWINSPDHDGFFRGGTPERYVELLERAYPVVKQIDPRAVVLGVNTTPPAWDQKVLAAGAYRSYDILSYHTYTMELGGRVDDGFSRTAQRLRERQIAYGPAKPLVNTEGGVGTAQAHFWRTVESGDEGDWSYHADQTVRMYVAQIAAGVRRFFFYSLHNTPRLGQTSWMHVEPGTLLKPLSVATAVLAYQIDGADYRGRGTPAAGASAHLFRRGSVTVAVLASDAAAPVPLKIAWPKGITAFDVWGNPTALPKQTTRTPLYLLARGTDGASALARVLGVGGM